MDTFNFEDIQKMNKNEFKRRVGEAVRRTAFSDLIQIKNTKNKIKHIHYEGLQIQDYLMSHQLTNSQIRFHFLARSRMLNIRDNYSSQYKKTELYCQSCLEKSSRESQQHIFTFCLIFK